MTRSLLHLVLVAALVTVAPTAAATVAVQSDKGAEEARVAKLLVGTWRLVSWTQRLANGTERPAATDVGYLIYTDVNRMCAMIMDSGRAKWPPGTPGTVADALARNAGYISYCAAVEINAKEGFVLHRVDMERNPNVIGTTRKRWFSFQDPNVLKLSIDAAELQANVKESVLTWARVLK